MAEINLCGKRGCRTHVSTGITCEVCQRGYFRCASHGGLPGAARSLHAHVGLTHPGSGAATAARKAFPSSTR